MTSETQDLLMLAGGLLRTASMELPRSGWQGELRRKMRSHADLISMTLFPPSGFQSSCSGPQTLIWTNKWTSATSDSLTYPLAEQGA